MARRETKNEKAARFNFYKDVLERWGGCWMTPVVAHHCDGPIDPAHLLPKQRLRAIAKDRYPEDEERQYKMIWGPMNGIPLCRAAHHKLDNGFIRLSWEQLPREARDYAIDWDLEWEMQQAYPKGGKDE